MANHHRKLSPQERRDKSRQIRIDAAQIAYDRGLTSHETNGDEDLPLKMMNFTKGLPHDPTTGLIQNENDYDLFVSGICSGNPDDIEQTPLGPVPANDWRSAKGQAINKVRAWESSGAGLTFDLEGPDAQAVSMKPAPKCGSNELTAEMAEVYAQAKLRDIPFAELATNPLAKRWFDALSKLAYFDNEERKNFQEVGIPLTKENLFRGLTEGDLYGPYVSQFLVAGNNGLNQRILNSNDQSTEYEAKDGFINYGSILIDQKVRTAPKDVNYMTDWDEYIDVQNGADFRGFEEYVTAGNKRRFITSGRDLATYVHYDALYEAYLNACLLLLGLGAPFDEGVPFQGNDPADKQQGFAHYGGPHILSLVTEVATRALKAVRYQKFNVHRRLRPEAFAARLEKAQEIKDQLNLTNSPFKTTKDQLHQAGVLDLVGNNKLLPMAFCEGSPMHPSYGAGHATVAGACVTILKAFFNHKLYLNISENGERIELSETAPLTPRAFVPNQDGSALTVVNIDDPLTIEGELNKLAANISIGRNWAGVHFYSDYRESLLLGEEIAIGLLEEQAITYNPTEKLSMTLPMFSGKNILIAKTSIKTKIDHLVV